MFVGRLGCRTRSLRLVYTLPVVCSPESDGRAKQTRLHLFRETVWHSLAHRRSSCGSTIIILRRQRSVLLSIILLRFKWLAEMGRSTTLRQGRPSPTFTLRRASSSSDEISTIRTYVLPLLMNADGAFYSENVANYK